MTTYKINCRNCGKVDHEVSNMSRKKGVKLRCTLCDRENPRWFNFVLLDQKRKENALLKNRKKLQERFFSKPEDKQ